MTESELIELIQQIKSGTEAEAMKGLKKYGNERYKAGAKNFAKLVQKMRYKQKHNPTMAGDLEKQVDRAVDVVLRVR